jgi:LuxR family maltose regulon positive regulatory protein
MPASLLATKLHIPPIRPNLVLRPRLIERLAQGLTRPLTLLSAPAGFGKTTLIANWKLTIDNFKLAWLSLDADDNDPARFLTYLVAAMETLQPGIGAGALALLQSPQSLSPKAVLTMLINGLAVLTSDFALVLDDYHFIEAQPVHDALTFLLDHLPSRMHLVIATRVDPPLPLPRLRVRDQLIEIRAVDLRFTSDEAAAFLNEVMGLGLASEDVAALEARTEGWIAGLQLAAMSMQGREDVAGFIAAFTGSNRYVLDYLVEEVLRRQPAGVQAFLMRTSILNRLCGPLCDAVTGRTDSQAMLTTLEQSNLFTIPLDEERRWYRYHNLFAEFLRSHSQTPSTDAEQGGVHQLHRRAAEWYENNGLAPEAIKHALAAQDFEWAARLIEQTARQTLMSGETNTLLGWLRAMPEAVIRSRPRLCLAQAWTRLFTGDLDAIELSLQQVSQSAAESEGEVQGEAAAIHALVAALKSDLSSAIEFAHQALGHLPPDDLFLRGLVAINLGMAYDFRGDMAAASRAYAEAYAIGQAAENTLLTLMAATQLADLEALQGRLHAAADFDRQAIRLAIEPGKQLPVVSMAYGSLGRLLYEWNDLEAASRCLTDCAQLGRQWETADMLATGSIYLAQVKQAQGDTASAQDLIRQADQALQGQMVSLATVSIVKAYQARLWVRQGNLEAAARWAQDYQARSDEAPGYLRQIEQTTLARVLMAQSKPEAAVGLLDPLLKIAESAGQVSNVIELLALKALAFGAQGQSAQAIETLRRTLTLAEPEGYVRVLVDEGEPMEWLLQRMKDEGGRMKEYVGKLLTAFGKQPPDTDLHPSSFSLQPLVEPLSERELEVLRLIADGFSNAEIAQRLVIALGTVKRHINNIYGKLEVQSRTQAVARAREMGLV